MIRDVHPGSESWFFCPSGILDPRVRIQKGTGSGSTTLNRYRHCSSVAARNKLFVRRKDARESSGSDDSLPVQKNKGNRNRILDSDEENKEEDEVDEDDDYEDDEDYQEDNGKISTFWKGTASKSYIRIIH